MDSVVQENQQVTGKTSPEQQPRPGRPRDGKVDAAIVTAALEGLRDLGYDRLSMEEIASRARVGKGALYRRWRSKAELVVAACNVRRDEMVQSPLPDTGSLRGDLEALAANIPPRNVIEPQFAIMAGLVGPALRDQELRAAIATTTLESPRQMLRVIFQRAVRRGEIPAGCDLDLAGDAIIAFNVFRWLLLGEMPDRDWVHRVLIELVYPAVTAKLE